MAVVDNMVNTRQACEGVDTRAAYSSQNLSKYANTSGRASSFPCQKSGISIVSVLGEGLRRITLFPLLRMFVRIHVCGAENMTGGGPYIFAANHASHLDTPTLLAALPLSLRLRVRVAAAADYFFTQRWKGALVSLLLNAFSFERKGPGTSTSLAQAQQLLRSGYSLLIFPEGTRTLDGRLQHFKCGVGKLAQEGTARVVPVWIEGTYAALPKGARWPRRQRVVIHLGTPLSFTHDSAPPAIAAEIERQVRALALQDGLSSF
jgi:1-acyl-sn-glycerol-3-phosphate acyltransferase